MSTITAPPKLELQHWADTRYSYEAAERLPSHMRPGGPVRMAMLLYLAQHPEGVSQAALGLIALGACGKAQAGPGNDDMQVICGHLAAEGLLATEPFGAGHVLFFSPTARKASRYRRLHGYTLPARIQPAKVTS